MSPSFEEQSLEKFGHSPEFYLRASSPQLFKENKKKFEERSAVDKREEGKSGEETSEEEASVFISDEILLKPKVRYV